MNFLNTFSNNPKIRALGAELIHADGQSRRSEVIFHDTANTAAQWTEITIYPVGIWLHLCTSINALKHQRKTTGSQIPITDLILYGPCIILQYICNPTRYTMFDD